MNKQLAKIEKASLEIQDRGILMFNIIVDYEDCGCQNIGGIVLDTFDKKRDSRVGTAYGCEMIRRILKEMGVNDFSEMSGKKIWVYGEGDGLSFSPLGFSALKVDNKQSEKIIYKEVVADFEWEFK